MPRRLPLLLATIALVAAACASGEPATTAAAVQSETDAAIDETPVAADDDDAEATASATAASDAVASDDAAAGEADGPAQPSVDALWWTADTLDGGELVAADLAGENVVLWMWAPWCSVCNREAPEVAAALAELPDDVTVIGVAGRDDIGPMQDFVAEHGLTGITHVVDADGSVWASYGVSYQPAWVFIDDSGEASVAAGALGYDGIFAGIDEVFRG